MMCEILAHERIDKRIRIFLPSKANALFSYCYLFYVDHPVHARNLSYRSLLDSAQNVLRPALISQIRGGQTEDRSVVPICGDFFVLKDNSSRTKGTGNQTNSKRPVKKIGTQETDRPKDIGDRTVRRCDEGLLRHFGEVMGPNKTVTRWKMSMRTWTISGLLRQDWMGTSLDDMRCWQCWVALTLL